MIDRNEFIEYCEVHTNMYGTAKSQITGIQKENKIPLLDIDVQGAIKFEKAFPDSNFIAIIPPSVEALK
jgi:guanylate kinase